MSDDGIHVLTLSLACEPWQVDRLDRMFGVANVLYNDLVANRKKALEQLERTRAWKKNTAAVREIKSNKALSAEKQQALLNSVYEQRNAMLAAFGLTKFAFMARIQKYRAHYKQVVGTHVAQKIADSVWAKFEDYLFGNGKEIRFRGVNFCQSVEGKNNEANLYYKNGALHIAKVATVSVDLSETSLNKYEREALFYEDGTLRDIRYVRLKREPRSFGWKYFIQFVVGGSHPVKVKDTGELLHPVGSGSVGLDIGPQTLAVVGSQNVELHLLARGAQNLEDALRRVSRAMDRSRRATNPEFFNADGTVIHKDRLPPELLDKRGRRRWKNSKSYERLRWRRRVLLSKQAALREQRHRELANRLLAYGDRFVVEDMDFQALAKKAKESKRSEQTGKYRSRKRFGKSVANRAPAGFLVILEAKATEYGGLFHRVSTFKTRASQYNHVTDEYHKKKLSVRWDIMPDGTKVQRDLYSAYLLQHVDDTLEQYDKDQLTADFEAFLKLHALEIKRLKTTAMPSSCGVRKL